MGAENNSVERKSRYCADRRDGSVAHIRMFAANCKRQHHSVCGKRSNPVDPTVIERGSRLMLSALIGLRRENHRWLIVGVCAVRRCE